MMSISSLSATYLPNFVLSTPLATDIVDIMCTDSGVVSPYNSYWHYITMFRHLIKKITCFLLADITPSY